MELEKLFIDINGPYLSMDKRIHTRQRIENGIQFGATRNKYGSNLIRVLVDENDTFTILFIKYSKPRYNKLTKQFEPHTSIIKYEAKGLTLIELKDTLNNAFN